MKKFKLIILLLVVLMLVNSGYALGQSNINEEEEQVYDFSATYSTDFFSYNYPEEWFISREHKESEENEIKFLMIDIADSEAPEGVSHRVSVDYSLDDDWTFREDENEFYETLDAQEEFFKDNEEIEFIHSNIMEFKNRPAYRLRIQGQELIHPEAEDEVETVIDVIFIYENQHQQALTYFSRVEEYNINLADTFFDSFEFK